MTAFPLDNHEGTTARRHDELKGWVSVQRDTVFDCSSVVPSCHRAIVIVATVRQQSVDTDASSH